MIRLPDEMLGAVCYMYRSHDDADTGSRDGATGFFVSVPLEDSPSAVLYYLVTARHVVEAGYQASRINLKGQMGTASWEWSPEHWEFPESGADVALTLFLSDLALEGGAVPASQIVTPEMCEELNIGVGDAVCMAGRLMHHDGTLFNRPAVRFGSISVLPDEPIRNKDLQNDQFSFVVEMRSVSGYSGSPVWVYRQGAPWPMKLLGVDWGHLPGATGSGIAIENVNMACVVPGWEILSVLYSKENVQMRKKISADLAELVDDDVAAISDVAESRPGPDPERLKLDISLEDVAKRVMEAGKPEEEDDGD